MSTKRTILAAALCAISLAGCNFGGPKANNGFEDIPDSLHGNAPLLLSENVVNEMIQNISSPVEMANQIKNSGIAFDQSMLNPANNIGNYQTSFKRALNLGVYSADLGYINTFNKNVVVLDYLLAVKELADGVGVGQFLDYTTLTRLAKSSTNLDSLKLLSVSSFNEMDRYLREKKRTSVSTAIVAGAWAEGIYITCNVIEKSADPDLRNRLAEQKEIVDILLILLNNYGQIDNNFAQLVKIVEDLKGIYENVRIMVEHGSPITKVVDGMIVIEQNEISHIDVTDEQIEAIIAKVKELRQFIIG